jgi:hypothetical protein
MHKNFVRTKTYQREAGWCGEVGMNTRNFTHNISLQVIYIYDELT